MHEADILELGTMILKHIDRSCALKLTLRWEQQQQHLCLWAAHSRRVWSHGDTLCTATILNSEKLKVMLGIALGGCLGLLTFLTLYLPWEQKSWKVRNMFYFLYIYRLLLRLKYFTYMRRHKKKPGCTSPRRKAMKLYIFQNNPKKLPINVSLSERNSIHPKSANSRCVIMRVAPIFREGTTLARQEASLSSPPSQSSLSAQM